MISRIHLDNDETIVLTPVSPDEEHIRMSVSGKLRRREYAFLTPGQAYLFGEELKVHAKHCGFEPEQA